MRWLLLKDDAPVESDFPIAADDRLRVLLPTTSRDEELMFDLDAPVLRVHQEDGVFGRGSLDVGNAQRIPRDAGFRRNWRGYLPGYLRQCPPAVPINRRQECDQQNRYAQVEQSEQAGRAHRS